MKTTVIKVHAALTGSRQPLILGKQGENGVREYVFDVYDLIDAFGDGSGTILLQRPDDDAPYPVKSQQAGGMIGWIVSDVDTNQAGACSAELRWETEDGTAKSVTYNAKVLDALGCETEIPARKADWISEVLQAGRDAADAASRLEKAASAAAEAATRSAAAAASANKDADDAKKAAGDAEEYGSAAIALYDSVFDVLTSQKGYFSAPEDLRRSYPTGLVGWWAIVGTTDTIWVWDDTSESWIDTTKTTDLSNYYTKSEVSAAVQAAKESMMPVGSIYTWSPRPGGPDLSTPAKFKSYIGFGTWVPIEGLVLQGADADHAAGTTDEAGLPNISGSFNVSIATSSTNYENVPVSSATGPFATTSTGTRSYFNKDGTSTKTFGYGASFDASRANAIYGASETVQPPALRVYYYQRVA